MKNQFNPDLYQSNLRRLLSIHYLDSTIPPTVQLQRASSPPLARLNTGDKGDVTRIQETKKDW